MGTTPCRYLCQPSTRTHGSGTLLGHRALPTALFPRKPLEIISCPAPAAPGTGPGSSYPAPTSEQRSIAWKGRGISLALAQDLHHWGQPALSAFLARANHKRITTRNGEKSRRQGPPAFPATPRGVSPAKGYPGTPRQTGHTPHAEQTSEVTFGEGVVRRELPRLSQAGPRERPRRSGTPCPPSPQPAQTPRAGRAATG